MYNLQLPRHSLSLSLAISLVSHVFRVVAAAIVCISGARGGVWVAIDGGCHRRVCFSNHGDMDSRVGAAHFLWEPMRALMAKVNKLTAEINGFVVKILTKEGNLAAAVCAILGYFALFRRSGE
ncbi:hypothetical protein Vadar_034742 [Vaccinium darrowii]|uniref:Uncharacterized protein n=1 Tax=Vaccinium darrowii TaxID=229202 RepID=A0ACB7ZPB9_9ERIC|nr:hypothetical protein Vadar_034742 [Vaccinium darrowii]